MSGVVFILGAGASVQAGAPVMGNFLDVAGDLLRLREVRDKAEDFERVFDVISKLQVVHSKAQLDLNNIESIFTVLELGRTIQGIPGLDVESIEGVINSLRVLIVETLEKTVRFPSSSRSSVLSPKPYMEFVGLVDQLRKNQGGREVSVVTFNYDVALDVSLHLNGMIPRYHLDSDEPLHRAMVAVLKLHGSLNWSLGEEDEKIRPYHVRNFFHEYTFFSDSQWHLLQFGEAMRSHFGRAGVDVKSEPVIVPPTWNKADYHSALASVWSAAAGALSRAEYIFIIGYSLPPTDAFFRHLYALGSVGEKLLRKIVVYNPDESEATKLRFYTLLGPGALARYEYKPLVFEDAIKDVARLMGV